jgi:hypothetical protein
MGPLNIAAEQLGEMAVGQVDVYCGDDRRRDWMKNEARQRKDKVGSHRG